MTAKPPRVPAACFGIVLGLGGLGNAWRSAHEVWQLPAAVGEAVMALTAAVWALLIVLYGLKWLRAPDAARAEAEHPVQCCFIGLVGIATMLVGLAALPYARLAAEILVGAGGTFTIAFALWRTGVLWGGGRDPGATTPVLYLPTVAGGFVTAIALARLGHADWARLAFGAGFFSWLAIESVLLHRLYTAPAMAVALRPTLGIQLAPPTVGALAYLSVNGGVPDLIASMLIGYGLLQALLLLRLLAWIRGGQAFVSGYWSFSFGLTALGTAPLRMIAGGDSGAVAQLAPVLFVAATVGVGAIALGTLGLIVRGRLLPPAVPAPPSPTPAA